MFNTQETHSRTNGHVPYKTMFFTTLRVSEDGIRQINEFSASKLCKTKPND